MQPCPRVGPVSVGRGRGEAKSPGRLFDRQAGEVAYHARWRCRKQFDLTDEPDAALSALGTVCNGNKKSLDGAKTHRRGFTAQSTRRT